MTWLKKIFYSNNESKSQLPVISKSKSLSLDVAIPEPTKSLLWVTNEDLSKISSPFTIKLTITLKPDGIKQDVDDGRNFYGEPSLIWTRLPVEKNTDLEESKMYYPSYSALYPRNKFQYLNWLRDVTQPTNLSYVFLYYYGLERHLLIGNYDGAVTEILRLLKYHDKGTFKYYVQRSLLVASLYRKRFDFIKENPFLTDDLSNESLIVRQLVGRNLTPKEIMQLARVVGVKNTRYIKLYSDQFESELEKLLISFEYSNGRLIDLIPTQDLEKKISLVFANLSLPESVRSVEVPQLLSNEKFKLVVKDLLEQAHKNVKIKRGR